MRLRYFSLERTRNSVGHSKAGVKSLSVCSDPPEPCLGTRESPLDGTRPPSPVSLLILAVTPFRGYGLGRDVTVSGRYSKMDHTISTRWGGRAWRYADFKGAVGRCFDPYARQPVQFEFAWEYESWLLSRFHPNTLSITHKTTRLTASRNGQELVALATFVVVDRANRLHYHLVFGNKCNQRRKHTLQRVAAITGAEVEVTSLMELRKDVGLFWRLEILRQASQLHAGEGADLDLQILSVIRSGAHSRDAVLERLHHLNSQLLNARLAHLHCEGSINLDFCRDNFGVKLVDGGDV